MKKSSCVCLWCAAIISDKKVFHRIGCRFYVNGQLSVEDIETQAQDFEEIKVFYAKITGTD